MARVDDSDEEVLGRKATSRNAREADWVREMRAVPRGWVAAHLVGLSPSAARTVVGLIDPTPMPPEVDYLALSRSTWKWISDHRQLIRAAEAAATQGNSDLSPQDQKALMDVRLKELQYLERCGELVSRRATERFLRALANKVKRNGEIAQREFGRRGWELAEELLTDILRDIESFSAGGNTEEEIDSS